MIRLIKRIFEESMYRQGFNVGLERGLARARARYEAQERERALSMCASWYQRKTDAEARGEPFDEPPPWERNGSSSLDYEPKSKS